MDDRRRRQVMEKAHVAFGKVSYAINEITTPRII
jgi:hypothetical protein